MTGKIHSIETCGTVDGPGIRFIIFFQGCPLRCQYCHNPDTWNIENGKEITITELMGEIIKYKSYMRFSGGGITASGGEPLMQASFVAELFRACKRQGIHTALDTSGFVNLVVAKEVLDYTDLVLLDIKSYHPQVYQDLTGVPLDPTLRFAEYLNTIQKPVWIRYVLVPNLTDDPVYLDQLASYLSNMKNVQKIEVLPFHKMGEYKWEELGYSYQLSHTPQASRKDVAAAEEIFARHGLCIK